MLIHLYFHDFRAFDVLNGIENIEECVANGITQIHIGFGSTKIICISLDSSGDSEYCKNCNSIYVEFLVRYFVSIKSLQQKA